MAKNMQLALTDHRLLNDIKTTVVLWNQCEIGRPLHIEDMESWLKLEPEKLSMLLASLMGHAERFNLYWDNHICVMKPTQAEMFDPICSVPEIVQAADQISDYLKRWSEMRRPCSEFWPRNIDTLAMEAFNAAVLRVAASVSLNLVCRDLYGNQGLIAVPAKASLMPPPVAQPVEFSTNGAKFYKCLIGRTSSGLPCLFNAPSDRTKPLPAGMLVEVRNLKSIRARPITLRGGNDQ